MSGEKGVGLKGWLTGPGQKRPKPDADGPAVLDRHRIAVLPLSNISPDPQDEYFADGMTEEVISRVSRIDGLEVISRTSVMQFKKTTRSVRDVSQELGVGTILEGSVRKSGNKLRVTVQIIDAARDKHLWSNSYDREMRDVFEIQSDIAENVADSLKLQLLGETRAEIKKRATENVDAYSLYLKGRFYWGERNQAAVNKATKCFEEAITKDPSFVMPYVGLADCYLVQMDQGWLDPKQTFLKARTLLDRALAIDKSLPEAHASLANLLEDRWDWASSEREYKRAIELNPNLALAHHWYSIFLAFNSRFDEALREAQTALRLDPISSIVNVNLGLRLAEMGRLEEGAEHLRKSANMDPGFGLAHAHLGQVLVSLSRFDEGIAELEKGFAILGSNPWGMAFLGYAYALKGDRAKALELRGKIAEAAETGFVPDALLGVVDFILGEKDKAYSEMKKAFDERSNALPYIRVFPLFRLIQTDPKFKPLLDQMISGQFHQPPTAKEKV